jgi:integrase
VCRCQTNRGGRSGGTPTCAKWRRNAGSSNAALAEGQPRITFHDLRHAFASVMIERGLSSTVLAHVMGHRDATTTERMYIHLFNRQRTDDQVREAMQSAMAL